MRSGLIAQKVGMTRIFTETATHVPVTVLKVDDCKVVRPRAPRKRTATAPFNSAPASAKVKNVAKPMRGHFAKAKVEPKPRSWSSSG